MCPTFQTFVTLSKQGNCEQINRANEEKEYDMKYHLIMENARKRLIDFYDNQEEVKKKERLAGAAVIRSQIAVSLIRASNLYVTLFVNVCNIETWVYVCYLDVCMNFGQFRLQIMAYTRLQNYTNTVAGEHEIQTLVVMVVVLLPLLLSFDILVPTSAYPFLFVQIYLKVILQHIEVISMDQCPPSCTMCYMC